MRAIILLALLGSVLAVPKSITRIVGGTDTTIQAYPYMSAMEYCVLGVWCSQSCGGSLITANVVLSAAHCVIGDSPPDWRIRLGSSIRNADGDVHAVAGLLSHSEYDGNTLEHDIALVRLVVPATFSNSIAAAQVGAFVPVDNTIATAIGWGRLWSGGPSSTQLQHVDVNVINQELCAERYAYLKTQPGYENWPDVTENMLCAGILDIGGKDTCQGDSGGPLAVNGNILIGVTSWGFRCADAYYPGVTTRISQYINWITANA